MANSVIPPQFSYDPALMAEYRALQRGYKDTKRDSRKTIKRGRRDKRTTVEDLLKERKRGKKDFATQLERGLEDISFKKQDTRLQSQRGQEDFSLQLEAVIRGFDRQGSAQMQAGNAAGLLGGGYAAAAARRRAENLAISRQPIDIGSARLREDKNTALGRLNIASDQLSQDIRRGRRRLKKDVKHDVGLARRDFRRLRGDTRTDRQRALREKKIGLVDIRNSMIFDARNRQPGAFSKTGRKS